MTDVRCRGTFTRASVMIDMSVYTVNSGSLLYRTIKLDLRSLVFPCHAVVACFQKDPRRSLSMEKALKRQHEPHSNLALAMAKIHSRTGSAADIARGRDFDSIDRVGPIGLQSKVHP